MFARQSQFAFITTLATDNLGISSHSIKFWHAKAIKRI